MKQKLNYICVQPDKPLFIWQLKVLLSSLIKLQIPKDRIFFLVLLEDREEPSKEMKELEEYAQIFYYKDNKKRFYVASSKPYLYARFFEENKAYLDYNWFYVESDMLIHKEPEIEAKNGIFYWSDSKQWLEVNKYEEILNYEKDSTNTSFGFHCIGKGIPSDIWYQIEKDSNDLYTWMIRNASPADNIWICEMRAWMWNMKENYENIVHPELDFNWGRGLKKKVNLHHQLCARIFNKRDYTNKDPWDINLEVDESFSLSDYIKAIKETNKLFNNGTNITTSTAADILC